MKNERGFTFIEIVLTIALIGAILTPIFMVQNNILRLLVTSSDRVQRVFMLKNVIHESAMKVVSDTVLKKLAFEKTIEDPMLNINFSIEPVSEKSSLKAFKDMYVVRSKGSWSRLSRDYDEAVVGLLYHPEKEKETS